MELSEYIRKHGAKKFAERFGVTERAALSWQYKTRRPRAEVAQKIVASTPVTFEGIYGESSSAA